MTPNLCWFFLMSILNPKAYPCGNPELTVQIFELIEIAKAFGQIKKGANETTKSINRGIAGLVIIAVDSDPLEIVLHLPLLCEDKNIPYIFVNNKYLLGKACGVPRAVIACSIVTNLNENLNNQIKNIQNKIEKFLN
ncbi:SNU13 snRNP subunit (nucleomorph) [Chroomonas mesostigmatica CCMP1168]|uniref:H/ACA ribonucleoprotein complex subunit 2 n=1 Tax=Chroomonas mesostigmatica CCMP1168 TaxID=1195612 RepID=J7G5A6_9CRYP|nr:SNU13 snRNP subunit [Chroomonas mesostigmatica CCMP1168]|mmetsp:Transcript_26011/g.64220  ORF Transcript_26011/g.64220 Transcript_26011/m.64220 type:complete len:137 (-) Transcript_26011:6160-6570(-)